MFLSYGLENDIELITFKMKGEKSLHINTKAKQNKRPGVLGGKCVYNKFIGFFAWIKQQMEGCKQEFY